MKRLLLAPIMMAVLSPAWAVDYYACSCDSGSVTMGDGSTRSAHGSCVAPGGDGSSAALARATHTSAHFDALNPGDRLLFCEGGKWNGYSMSSPLARLASSFASNPITIGSYAPPTGATGQPILNLTSGVMFTIGNFLACNQPRGGLIIQDLLMFGASTTSAAPSGNYAIYGVGENRNIQFLRNTFQGWRDAIQISAKSMYDDCNGTNPGVYQQLQSNMSFVVVQGNDISYNYSHGMLIAGSDSLVEGNTFVHNNMGGSPGVHAIYWAGASANYSNDRVTFRNNAFSYNSATMPFATDPDTGSAGDGITCRLGNLTMRQMRGVRVENNTVFNGAARDTCYGLNNNIGYSHAEVNRDAAFRGNTVVNPGGCGVCGSSTDSVMENNVVVMLNASQTSASGGLATLVNDGHDQQATVKAWRNNSLYLWGGTAVWAAAGGTPSGQNVGNNLVMFWGGSSPRTAFAHDLKSTFTGFDGNLVHNATQFSSTYTTMGTENDNCPSGVASFDCSGVRADPLLVATPSCTSSNVATGCSMAIQAGSPAVAAGQNSLCARLTKDGKVRTGTCTIGAYQPGL